MLNFLKRLAAFGLILGIAEIAGFLIFAPGIMDASRNAVHDHDPYPVSDAAQALHQSLVIGDLHADPLLWKRDITQRATRRQVDIPRLIEGGVAVQAFTAVTKSPAGQNYDANETDAFDNIALLTIGQLWPIRTWNSLLECALYQAGKRHTAEKAMPEQFRILRSRADLDTLLADRAARKSVVGSILGIEGGHPLEGVLGNLDRLEAAGYRLIALQHFFDNAVGGSLHGASDAGLTNFGKAVMREVAARGMIFDVAHSSPQVARDVLA